MNQQNFHIVLRLLPYLPEACKLIDVIEIGAIVEQTILKVLCFIKVLVYFKTIMLLYIYFSFLYSRCS